MQHKFIIGETTTALGTIPVVSTIWSQEDLLSTIRVRWSIGRMHYTVAPGLYGVGTPDEYSRVYVTANFKLSFDHLRQALDGFDAWILVLDTKGINVWCAAGKGTFGTKELIKRINAVELHKIVNHRKLILPQLGAVGVSAHEVKNQSGFSVIYGPVRAADIKAFVDGGMKASPAMRRVEFPLKERLKLVPVEMSYAGYYLLMIPAVIFLLSGLYRGGYSVDRVMVDGYKPVINLITAYLAGCAVTPALLPWVPFRRFSLKGLVVGWILGILLYLSGSLGGNVFEVVSWFLMIGGISAFMAMNFTGTSTFTSLSGVQKEMKLALPLEIGAVGLGVIGWIITRFI